MRQAAWMMAVLMTTASPAAMASAQSGSVAPSAAPQQRGQDPDPGAPGGGDMAEDVEEVVVTGSAPRGSVPGDVKPELVLNPADIRAYGVGSLAELLTELEPQTRSGRGRGGGAPVLLLSGRRISGFGEIRDIPPEAIERIDILPEEAALKLGYRADQRVVNIVLRRRFRSFTVELDGSAATDGGTAGQDVELSMLRLNPNGRINLDLEYERDSMLLESERDIVQDPASPRSDIDFRSLRPATQSLTMNGVLSRNIGKTVATANLRMEQNWSDSLLGLPTGGTDPLERSSSTNTLQGGVSFNGDISTKWRWSLTGNWDRAETRTLTDRNTGLTDWAQSVSNVGSVDGLVNGPLADLPAGAINSSLRLAARTSDFDAQSRRAGVYTVTDIGRTSGSARANIDLPIASRSKAVLGPLGNLSLNANAEVEQLSDFGTLLTYGYGVNWSPIDGLRMLASFTEEEGAPSAQQLGNPVVATPNVRVFDFVRGETVDIIRTDGGNPGLSADNRSVMKLGLNYQPIQKLDLSFNLDYTKITIRNPISSFPTATAEIEAAFPDRFERDGAGQLIRIDNRPVNFARSEREQLRWGINFSAPISSPLARKAAEEFRARREAMIAARQRQQQQGQPQPGQAGENAPPPPEGAGPRRGEGAPGAGPGGGPRFGGGGGRGPGGGGFGGFGGPGGGGGGGRLQFGVFHTVALTDRITIRDGLPELDLLGGSATGSRGGSPRHQVEVRAGVVRDGIGLRLNADWQSATRVAGGRLAPVSFASTISRL
ncbi:MULTISPECIES: TonB-dependent receptor [unclassified Sphingomonas]|uniref:TonB-dependent receptor n=1 Tax=unclassified Sphingomonas TaxID=196159 RepID=UPI002151445A|nr:MULTISPECIES: TonB-dependent receptor [unclassified Sphingomonas]MCR5870491.1 TonB-dependent receptor [Sphingomonas sp. J344]UUY01163.1 TonB-dependent receptor [Sphingomonas sp. J315]